MSSSRDDAIQIIRRSASPRAPVLEGALHLVGYGEVLADLSSALPRFHLAGTLMVYPDSRNVNSALRIGREVSDRILGDER